MEFDVLYRGKLNRGMSYSSQTLAAKANTIMIKVFTTFRIGGGDWSAARMVKIQRTVVSKVISFIPRVKVAELNFVCFVWTFQCYYVQKFHTVFCVYEGRERVSKCVFKYDMCTDYRSKMLYLEHC